MRRPIFPGRSRPAVLVEHHYVPRIDEDFYRLIGLKVLYSMRQHHPADAGEIEVHVAFRTCDLGDKHPGRDRHCRRTAAFEHQMMRLKTDRVGCIGNA
jgi:hypothetical protein